VYVSKHTPEEKDQALVLYAMADGRKELVIPWLKEAGIDVGINTLRGWVRRDGEHYDQIRQECEAYKRSEHAEMFSGLASLANEVSTEAMRQLRVLLAEGAITPKELPKVAVSASTTAGIATDKSQLLSGNPTARVAHDVDDLQRELASVGITVVIPGAVEPGAEKPTAIDVTPKPSALPSADH
jgi:hypothetical protein